MKSGRRSKRSQIRFFVILAAFACFYLFSNVTAATKSYQTEATILPDNKLLSPLIRDISEAQKNIYLAMYMFKSYSNTSNGAGLIKKALTDAADRGIKVYVVLDQTEDTSSFLDKENKKLGKELQKHNIEVYYDSENTRMHSKCAVIDENIVYIGSHNYTNSALKHNHEISVRLVSKEAAEEALNHIKGIR